MARDSSSGSQRKRRRLGPGELRSPCRHEDEEVAAARWLYLRALEKYAPEVYEKETCPPTRPHPDVAGISITTSEIPPIGLVKVQDDQIESVRQYLVGWLKHLEREAVQRGRLSPMEYEAPPDYYPDEQTENQYLGEVRAYIRRQVQQYLEAGFVFEKGRATWGSPVFEALRIHLGVDPVVGKRRYQGRLVRN